MAANNKQAFNALNSPKQTHYQIDDWRVDFSSNVISKDDVEVKIEAKTMAVLKYLVEHANQTVTRDELLDEIWSEMVTVQDVVTNAVGKLRKALGDSKRQIIVTVPKVGYKLNAQVSKITPKVPVVTEVVEEQQHQQPQITASQIQSTASQVQNRNSNKGLLMASIAVLLLLVVYLVISKVDKDSEATLTRIAVMPMKNLGDPSTEYFSEGLADSIRAQLTRSPKLQVIAKTSVAGFAKEEDVKSIGEQLDIGYVITGGVRKTNEEVTINLQLINLDSDALEWSDSFIGTVDDAFRFQKAIAQSIANALTLKLDPPKVALAEPTAKAQQFFQLGQYYRYKRTTADYYHTSFDVAIDYYHKAIAESPDYAEAYAELARSWIVLAVWGYSSPNIAVNEAQIAADKALALNPDSYLGHIVQGMIKFLYHWQWLDAEKQLRKAIQINPSSSDARQWLALLLSSKAKHQEAYEQMVQAENTDPLSPLIKTQKAYLKLLAGDLKSAASLSQAAIDFNPFFHGAHFLKGWVSNLQGDFGAAEQQLKQAEDSHFTRLQLAVVYANSGQTDQAMALLNDALALRKETNTYISAYSVTTVYTALGQHEEALEWLALAIDEKAVWVSRIRVDPDLDALRGLAEFQRLLEKLPF